MLARWQLAAVALFLVLNVAAAYGTGGSHVSRLGKDMQLFVKTSRGETIALQVNNRESIESVRRLMLVVSPVLLLAFLYLEFVLYCI